MQVMDKQSHTIVLGGGCFWCIEAVFKDVKGVTRVTSGYAGGTKENPSYGEVLNGSTGHAEVIKVEYDPSVVTLQNILAIFFASHNPTTINRQGNDAGTNYRSIILYNSQEQGKAIQRFMVKLKNSKLFDKEIVTEIKPLETFFAAEPEHMDYYARNRTNPYCEVVIVPKLSEIKKKLSIFFK